jgi:predicted nucleotidyltransferase
MLTLHDIEKAVHDVGAAYGVRRALLFGSYAEGRATSASDVDLIVEFDKSSVSLFTLNGLRYDLEERLGRPVDVIHGPLNPDAMITPGRTMSVYGQ